jgi:hypothetical protein
MALDRLSRPALAVGRISFGRGFASLVFHTARLRNCTESFGRILKKKNMNDEMLGGETIKKNLKCLSAP